MLRGKIYSTIALLILTVVFVACNSKPASVKDGDQKNQEVKNGISNAEDKSVEKKPVVEDVKPVIVVDAEYVGVAKCKACHSAQYKIWSESKHAKALETIKSAGKDDDPGCMICHNTGIGKAQASGAELDNVQCEACHGAGSKYKSPSIMSKSKFKADKAAARKAAVEAGLIIPDEKVCVECHNTDSPNFSGFDFAKYKAKIKHWQ